METAPQWLTELVDSIATASDSLQTESELGCHVYFAPENGEWEITLFAEPPAWGGRLKPPQAPPVLSVDISRILRLFDRVSNCRWQTTELTADDDLGPHLSVEGDYRGHPVWVRLLSRKPSVLDVSQSPLTFLQN